MTNHHCFRLSGWDRLEYRLALTHGGPVTPALIGTLSPTPAAGTIARFQAQVNQSFDQFTTDYFQAQGAYLSSGAPSAYFTASTTERVYLLAQELHRILSRVPGSLDTIDDAQERSVTNHTVDLWPFLRKVITGPAPPNSSSLLQNLDSVIPPPGTHGAAATLYTLSAANAIQAARHATINVINYIVRA
jgi:hypothetical protein